MAEATVRGADESPYTPHECLAGRLFLRLMARAEFLHVFHDGETFAVNLTDRDGVRSRSQGEAPLGMLMAALGVRGEKQCLGPCGRLKPFCHFGGDKNNPDGLLRRCKVCERARVRGYSLRKREAAGEEV